MSFDVGDLVWVYLRKERLPKGKHTKLMQRKIGPCSILKKFGPNAYEVQLPNGLGLSPTFNVCDLTPYEDSDVATVGDEHLKKQTDVNFPKHKPPTIEKVLDTRVVKKTRNKEYKQYLVKWKGQPDNEAM